MKIVFLGSPACVIPVLDSLFASNHQIVAVVSQPASKQGRGRKMMDPPVAEYAKQKGLEVLQPMKASDPNFLQRFQELQPDVAVTAAYGQILTQKFLDIPRRATINIHPSLLPLHRGATPVQNTLLSGDQKTGVSILFTVKALDAGAIIHQTQSDIAASETAETLLDRLFQEGGEALPHALSLLEDPDFSGIEQDINHVTHCRKIQKTDGCLQWSESSEMIMQRFKAYQPWPGVYSFLDGKRLVLTNLQAVQGDRVSEKPGTGYWDATRGVLRIQCGSGVIDVQEVKPEGKKLMTAQSFCNGRSQKEYDFTTE